MKKGKILLIGRGFDNGRMRFGLLLALAAAARGVALGEASVYQRKWTRSELEATVKESEQWLGSDIGKDQIVPAPWTAMKVEGQTVECWGKTYRYDDSILPVSLISQGRELLKTPPVLVMQTGGRRIVFREAAVTLERRHDGLVNVKSVARHEAIRVEFEAGYEFDGMGKIALRLSAAEPVMADSLHLEFPLSEKHTVLYHWAGSRSRGLTIGGKPVPGAALPPMSDSGGVPANGVRLDLFREVLWFGDRDVGFSWFADGMKGWPIKDEIGIQALAPAKEGARILSVKLADKTFSLAVPLELVFGIQATPMRPRPKDFRTGVGFSKDMDTRGFSTHWRWGDGYYYPFQDTYPDAAREDVNAERANGHDIMPTSSLEYFGKYRFARNRFGPLHHPGLAHREVLLWQAQWDQVRQFAGTPQQALEAYCLAAQRKERRLPGGKGIDDVLALERHTHPSNNWDDVIWRPQTYPERFCYNSSFQDFYVWKMQELVRQTGLSALYLDQQLYQCANPEHGCGYIDYKGEWAPQGNVFAMREMVKRIYKVMYKLNGRAPKFIWHCSQQLVVPAMSFIYGYYDGEKYTVPNFERSIVGNEFYSSFLSGEIMQVQHMGRQFGFAPVFLPQVTRDELRGMVASSPTVATTRDMLGLLMIHDSHISAHTALTYHGGLAARVMNKRLSYELDRMRVAYYWEEDNGVAVHPPQVKSILHYGDKRALLILFNWGGDAVEAGVKLDLGRFKMRNESMKLSDALTGETLHTENDKIATELLPRDFRMIGLDW